jgi:DNA-binding NarL/FixJ family response regulator
MDQHGVAGANPAVNAPPLRVLIADDAYLVREGLRQLLQLSDDVVVQGGCVDEPGTLEAVDADPPDVLVTDIRMPPTFSDEGIRIAERLRESHPGLGIVVLSQDGDVGLAARLLEDGASGRAYLLKDRVHDLEHLVSTIVAVARGECRVDPGLVQQLVARQHSASSPLDALTPRQRELLADIAEGKSNLAIARDRFLSQRAVEKHVSEIFGRLGITGDADVSRRVVAALVFLDAPTR